jgi:hypothetical protein
MDYYSYLIDKIEYTSDKTGARRIDLLADNASTLFYYNYKALLNVFIF